MWNSRSYLIHERSTSLKSWPWAFEACDDEVDVVTSEVFAFPDLRRLISYIYLECDMSGLEFLTTDPVPIFQVVSSLSCWQRWLIPASPVI